MNLNYSKIAAGAFALLAGTVMVASAAHAAVTPVSTHGMYTVLKSSEGKICALRASSDKAELIIAHSGVTHETSIMYTNPDMGDLTGLVVPVTIMVDAKEYDWKGSGHKGAILVTTADTTVPIVLKNAEMFGAKVLDTPLFALKSDTDFEAAMTDTLNCAHGK